MPKTSLTASVAGLLATSGYRVVVVYLDPQGNLAEDLGNTDDDRDDKGRRLTQALMFGGGAAPAAEVRHGFDVLEGSSVLDQATADLSSPAHLRRIYLALRAAVFHFPSQGLALDKRHYPR